MESVSETRVTFLGTSTALPDIGSDTASFLINEKYLVDTGWSLINNLRNCDIDPLQIEYLFFTHMHHDHYLSLPSLFFYFLMKRKDLKDLKIIGPADDVERIVTLALNFLQKEVFYSDKSFPTIIPLSPGDNYDHELFHLTTCDTIHPVQGLCYRFTDKRTGKCFSFTGDSAYYPKIAEHVKGSSFLIHEASLGPIHADPSTNHALHSGALDAALIAESAQVGKLYLVHGALSRKEECVQAASQIYKGTVEWPADGQTIVL